VGLPPLFMCGVGGAGVPAAAVDFVGQARHFASALVGRNGHLTRKAHPQSFCNADRRCFLEASPVHHDRALASGAHTNSKRVHHSEMTLHPSGLARTMNPSLEAVSIGISGVRSG
jgi:hypothetical protein